MLSATKRQRMKLSNNFNEIMDIECKIHSQIDDYTLDRLYVKYSEYPHPLIHYKFGVAYLIKNQMSKAKKSLFKGAEYGIEHPSELYNDPMIDSIGQCFSFLVSHFYSKNFEVSFKVTALAYTYLSKCISMMPNGAYDSYRTRAVLFMEHENKMVLQKFILDYYGLGALYEPFALSDFYISGMIPTNPNNRISLESARKLYHYMDDISINGKDASDYTIKELASIGLGRHKELFKNVERDLLKGEFWLSKNELYDIDF